MAYRKSESWVGSLKILDTGLHKVSDSKAVHQHILKTPYIWWDSVCIDSLAVQKHYRLTIFLIICFDHWLSEIFIKEQLVILSDDGLAIIFVIFLPNSYFLLSWKVKCPTKHSLFQPLDAITIYNHEAETMKKKPIHRERTKITAILTTLIMS